jgi:V8-like Glu-specific endopeptidase
MSCGASKSDKAPSTVKGTNGLQARNVNELADKILFQCKSGESCPSSFGLIVNGKDRRSSNLHCTGFFLSKNLVVTSSSCVKDSYVRSQDICQNNFAVKDIYNNTALCKRVIYKGSSYNNIFKTDFALVELDRDLDVDPVDINAKGFSTNKSYSFWRARKTYQNDVFELKRTKHCRATKKNIVFPEGTSGNSKTVAFKNCPVEEGDFGSALLDYDGKVTGIIWGGESRSSEFSRFMSGKAGRSLTYASPLSCVIAAMPKLFPEITLSRDVIKECKVERNRYSLSQFFKSLSRVFLSSNEAKSQKVIHVKHARRSSRSFYKISHPECIDSAREEISICEFYPSLNTSYEIRSKNLDRCYNTKRVKSKLQRTLFGEFDLDIYADGDYVSRFSIPACN